jgi:hypothetical protein
VEEERKNNIDKIVYSYILVLNADWLMAVRAVLGSDADWLD